MSEVISEVGDVEPERIVVVSGPNLAREIALKQPAASVVACSDAHTAERVAEACAAPYFRPYTNTDVVGSELGGAVKNVIALAVGMAEGMGMGDNSKATIITRGLAETTRLGVALGGDPATFAGLAGVGDLIATCMSPLSRNRTFGVNLGRGMAVPEVVAVTRQTAEGVKSCDSILQLAKEHGVDVPIIEQVAAVVHEGRTPQQVVESLLSRARKAELD
jgi:glycerol-3-phosphate dehydrogenase (NAD(P)+)